MIIIYIMALGVCFGLVKKRKQAQTMPKRKAYGTRVHKNIDIQALQDELSFLEVKLDALKRIDANIHKLQSKPQMSDEQKIRLLRQQLMNDQNTFRVTQKIHKLERLLNVLKGD